MAEEIERKFLLKGIPAFEFDYKEEIKQGYIHNHNGNVVRVRIKGDTGLITMKTKCIGIVRKEYEYEIPKEDAQEMLDLMCNDYIYKIRYYKEYEGHTWEVDVFSGKNLGLTLAEIELTSVDEFITIPSWIGKEVTQDFRYYNNNLIDNPFCNWSRDE